MAYRFVESPAAAALCRSADGRERGVARRVLIGEANDVAIGLEGAAATSAALLDPGSGRVQGSEPFEDAALQVTLGRMLPATCAAALRPRFEWYGCFGAFFHNDAHYDGVLFGVLAVIGPPRDLYFPRIDVGTSARPGAWAVFDPFEPHGVVAPGRRAYQRDDHAGSPATVFVGFELELTPGVAREFGIVAASALPARVVELSSRSAIHAETGAVS